MSKSKFGNRFVSFQTSKVILFYCRLSYFATVVSQWQTPIAVVITSPYAKVTATIFGSA